MDFVRENIMVKVLHSYCTLSHICMKIRNATAFTLPLMSGGTFTHYFSSSHSLPLSTSSRSQQILCSLLMFNKCV